MSYQFLPGLFLRAPFYSYLDYDPERLPEALGRQSFRNALRLASAAFYAILEKKDFDHGALSAKERHTLAKYYNRMCFRPTPFGCFATFTVLDWAKAGSLKLAGDSAALLHLMPDQSTISRLSALRSSDSSRPLMLNPTLYTAGPAYRFIRSSFDASGQPLFSLDTLDLLPFHTQLLAKVRAAAISANDLAAWIAGQTGCAVTEAADYVDFLVQAQVLFGPERGQIISATGQKDTYADLNRTVSPEQALPRSIDPDYAATERPLLSGRPDSGTREELSRAVGALARLSPSAPQPALKAFTNAFAARYDRRKVPLLEALDPDTGIGYGELTAQSKTSGLLEGLPFGVAAPEAGTGAWDPVRQLLFRRWPRDSHAPLTLRDQDLRELSSPPITAQPSTLAVLYRKAEGHLLIEHAGGATANALAGRFSVFSPDAHALCLEIAAREKAASPGVLLADIGQLAHPHTDNINRRKQIYDQEIPINTFSALDPDAQLPPGDLLLSVHQDILILESASRGMRVIPRMPTAFNFRKNSLSVFRLLCDLQYQQLRSPLSLDIERLFPGLEYYPRVTYGGSILSLARWKLKAADIATLLSGQESLAEMRLRLGLPQRVSMGREDQQLVFDLTEPEEATFFQRCLKPGQAVTLYEYLWPDRSIKTAKGPLAGQFLAVLAHDQPVYAPLAKEAALTGTTREFRTGSEWLYLKIYCTPRTAGLVLRDIIAPFTRRKKKQIGTWFFIRYADSGHHLRLRLRIAPEHTGQLLAGLEKAIARSGYHPLVNDYQTGMYTRELERYGADIIETVEGIFQAGSEFVLAAGDDAFGPAFALTEAIVLLFYDLEEAIAFTAGIAANFLTEFGGAKALRAGLDQKYRELKKQLAEDFSLSAEAIPLMDRLKMIREIAPEWTAERTAALLADLIHMQVNRAFSADSRRHELLVYYCLNKQLVSRAKRKEDH